MLACKDYALSRLSIAVVETEGCSTDLEQWMRDDIRTEPQLTAFARALEIIPRQTSDNAGLDSTNVLNKLQMWHANGEKWTGVDVEGVEGVRDNMEVCGSRV
jgi:chaperonin GroEL (HSP60 family)